MSADVVKGLIAFLKADTDVAAQVGARVFGIRLPASEAGSMPRKAVVLTPSGGASLTAGSYVEHDTQRFDAFCYGKTEFEAEAVRLTVDLALRRLRRATSENVLIHWVQSAGGYAPRLDPDADWPIVFQSFQAFHALNQTA